MGILDKLIDRMTSITDEIKEAIKRRDEQQWEYRVVNLLSTTSLTERLNELGSERWELVLRTGDYFVFKRPRLI